MAAMSEEGVDIPQDLQGDYRAGHQKANSQFFNWATESEWNEKTDVKSIVLRKEEDGIIGLAHTSSVNNRTSSFKKEQLESGHHKN